MNPAPLARKLVDALGGPARAGAIAMFASVLGLQTADISSIGSVAPELTPALHLSDTDIGLLAALPSIGAAFATLPVGMLADRIPRMPILRVGITLWAAGMIASAIVASFTQLALVRVALGLVTAVAGPPVASLIGDFFEPSERGRVYGVILTGELFGSGFGLLVSSNVASLLSWRVAFGLLGLLAGALAFVSRRVKEPRRGGLDRFPALGDGEESDPRRRVAKLVREHGERPDSGTVLREDPRRIGFLAAVRYVLTVRTNVAFVIASSLGYFFIAGVETFGVMLIGHRFAVSSSLASLLLVLFSLGALVGTVGGGRLADRMLRSGRVTARPLLAGVCYTLGAALLALGLATSSLPLAIPLFIAATACVGAPNPALDAARLDVMPSMLWGRAEGVRTVLRTIAVAAAPLLFGALADLLGSGARSSKGGYSASTNGLTPTFLIMLAPMLLAGIVLLRVRHRYPRDVAAALASEEHAPDSGQRREDGQQAEATPAAPGR